MLVGAASVLQGLSALSQIVSTALQEHKEAVAGAAAEPAQAAAQTSGDVGCSYQQSPTCLKPWRRLERTLLLPME